MYQKAVYIFNTSDHHDTPLKTLFQCLTSHHVQPTSDWQVLFSLLATVSPIKSFWLDSKSASFKVRRYNSSNLLFFPAFEKRKGHAMKLRKPSSRVGKDSSVKVYLVSTVRTSSVLACGKADQLNSRDHRMWRGRRRGGKGGGVIALRTSE